MWDILVPETNHDRLQSTLILTSRRTSACCANSAKEAALLILGEGTSGHGTLAKTGISDEEVQQTSAGHFNSCLIIFLRLGLQSQRHLEIPAPPGNGRGHPQYQLAGTYTVLKHG